MNLWYIRNLLFVIKYKLCIAKAGKHSLKYKDFAPVTTWLKTVLKILECVRSIILSDYNQIIINYNS